jgi:CheY-like chemotaxis protein
MHELLAHTLGPNITVGVTAADDLPLMLADRGRLETTLVNLGTNARDAMTEGGHLHFMAEADSATRTDFPHWAGLASGAYIRLSVIDTGSGMDAATLAQAGEPFFTTKGLGAGTGLGLSMAKAFAEQSGGALRIASAPGEGTTIALWLPAARETADAPPRARTLQKPSQAAVSRGSRQVLLVDDDRIIRDSLDLHLRDAGFSVVRAASGSEAVGLLDRGLAVDALVTDLAMPDLDGLAVIRAAQQRHPRLPAILLTGFAGDDGAAAMGGAMQGSFSLLRKPVQENQLIERLQALLAEGD